MERERAGRAGDEKLHPFVANFRLRLSKVKLGGEQTHSFSRLHNELHLERTEERGERIRLVSLFCRGRAKPDPFLRSFVSLLLRMSDNAKL